MNLFIFMKDTNSAVKKKTVFSIPKLEHLFYVYVTPSIVEFQIGL